MFGGTYRNCTAIRGICLYLRPIPTQYNREKLSRTYLHAHSVYRLVSVDSGYPGAGDAQIFEHRYRLGVEAEEEQVLPREDGVFLHQEDEVFLDRDELLAHNLSLSVIWTARKEQGS